LKTLEDFALQSAGDPGGELRERKPGAWEKNKASQNFLSSKTRLQDFSRVGKENMGGVIEMGRKDSEKRDECNLPHLLGARPDRRQRGVGKKGPSKNRPGIKRKGIIHSGANDQGSNVKSREKQTKGELFFHK